MVLEKPEYTTYTSDCRILSMEQASPTRGTLKAEVHQLTNFEELDRSSLFSHPEIITNQTFDLDVSMIIENDGWQVASIQTAS